MNKTEILNSGGTLPGVTAEEDISISVRERRGMVVEV